MGNIEAKKVAAAAGVDIRVQPRTLDLELLNYLSDESSHSINVAFAEKF